MSAGVIAISELKPTSMSRGAAFGLGWSTATQVVSTLIRLVSTLILTRLLAPDDYALIGTATVVLTTLGWLSEFGLTAALVRHPRGGDTDWLLVGWWITLGRGFAITSAAAIAAFPLAAFFHQPELIGVLFALALRPVVYSLRSPGLPKLQRRLEYRALFVDEMVQVIVGAGISIAIAWFVPHAGGWAIVGGSLGGAISGVIVSYCLVPMCVRWFWDRRVACEVVGFGGWILLNTIVMAAWLNLDRLVGPRFLTLDSIGWYAIAWNLASAAESLMTRKIDVYFSLLARLDPQDRVAWHRRTVRKVMFLAGPILAICTAIAPLAIRILYDSRYHASGLLLSVLLARLILRTASQLDFQLLLAEGKVLPATWAYAAGALVQASIAIPLAIGFGVIGLAASVLFSTAIVAATQAFLGPGLGSAALGRLSAAGVWATAGLAIAIVVERSV